MTYVPEPDGDVRTWLIILRFTASVVGGGSGRWELRSSVFLLSSLVGPQV
jgi:hypothetical protein